MKPAGLFLVACLLMSLLSGGLSGCLMEPRQPGVAALVNGRPISLRLIEVRHDSDGGLAAVAQNPSVDLLRKQYGAILAELIVQELACQELERLGLEVTAGDVERASDEVLGDYPDQSLAEVLAEAHVDEATWRALLRYTVALTRFNEQVLRPRIRLDAAEVERHYVEHAAEFFVPLRLSLLVLTAPTRKAVTEARDRVLAGNGSGMWLGLPDVQSERMDIRSSLLPDIWQDEAGRLAAGKATEIRETNEGFQCLILEKRKPARRLSPVEAYPRIEQALVETKMAELFAAWLEAAVSEARISVLRQLLPHDREKESRPAILDDEPRNSEPFAETPRETGEEGEPVPVSGTPRSEDPAVPDGAVPSD